MSARAFSNSTEGSAWMACWCDCCAHDHGMHDDSGGGCSIIFDQMFNSDPVWPEPWLREPDDGRFFLPSRIVCLQYQPCEACEGDPGAVERAVRVAEVKDYWRLRAGGEGTPT